MVFLDVEKYFNKNVVILLGGCLTVKNEWGLLTGDDVVGFRDTGLLPGYLGT